MKCPNCGEILNKCYMCDCKYKKGESIHCIDKEHNHVVCIETEYPPEFEVVE